MGVGIGVGLMRWFWRGDRHKDGVRNHLSQRVPDPLTLQHHAWEAFGLSAVALIPVLKKQMEAVTEQTERAAMELMVHLNALAAVKGAPTGRECAPHMTKIVMAMQFQDITKQKLDHVVQALDQVRRHLQILLKGPLSEEAKQDIAILEKIERSYTMEEERRLHAEAMTPDYQEPVPVEVDGAAEDSVTLF